MFRLFTFLVSVVGFAALVWFGVTVDLGNRTLFGHLRAIGQSDEAQQLWSGTKDKVTDFVGIEAARRAEAAKAAFKNPGIVDERPGEAEGGKAAAPAVERALPAEKDAPGQAVTRTAPPVVYKPAPTAVKAAPPKPPAKTPAHVAKPAPPKPSAHKAAANHKAQATKPAAHKPAVSKPHDKTTGLRAQASVPTSR